MTVNYGSGTPAEAAAWVAAAARTRGRGRRALGSRERDLRLLGGEQRARRAAGELPGYKPATIGASNPTCPQTTEGAAAGTRTLATSYAANAQRFLRAMKAADPAARIGVPWAFGSPVRARTCRTDSAWNDTVLGTDGKYVSFVDAHYYPFSFTGGTGGANPTDQQVLRALREIPALYGDIRAG